MMPLLTPLGVILGLLFCDFFRPFKPAVNFLFGFLTLINGMGVAVGDFAKVFSKRRAILSFLVCSYIAIPLLYTLVSRPLFSSETAIGFTLLAATPTAVVGTIWSSIYGGNRALSLALLVLGTLLAPFATPLIVSLLSRESVAIDSVGMMTSLLLMVLLPSFAGILINFLTKGHCNDHVSPALKPFTKLALVLVITINTSQVAREMIADLSVHFLLIAVAAVSFFFTSYILTYRMASAMKLEKEDAISVTFASSMKNISASMVLAIDFFPPQSVPPVLTGILLQQTTGAFASHFLFLRKAKTVGKKRVKG